MLIESVDGEYAQRDECSGLAEGLNQQAGRMLRVGGIGGCGRKSPNGGCIPGAVRIAREYPEGNAFGNESRALAGLQTVADFL